MQNEWRTQNKDNNNKRVSYAKYAFFPTAKYGHGGENLTLRKIDEND